MHGVVRGMYRRGTFMLELGEVEAAVEELQRGAAYCERYGFALVQRGILYNLVCAYSTQTQPALMLATVQRGWALQQGLAADDMQVMFLTAFVDAHLALGQLGAAWARAGEAIDAALALKPRFFAASTAKTCLELLSLLGAHGEAARLLAPLDDTTLRQMPQVADEMWIAQAQAALLMGDIAAAREVLGKARDQDATQMPRQHARLRLAQAELALAEGDATRALAALPGLHAPGMNDEMRLIEVALRIRTESAAGALTGDTVAAAQAQLVAETMHAVAALHLHRALAAAHRAGVKGVPDGAARDAAAHIAALGSSLQAFPVQQAAFMRFCA